MKIAIIYKIYKLQNMNKYNNWHDGFTKAIDVLKKIYDITMINFYDNQQINYNNYDLILIKEGFNSLICQSVYKYFKINEKKCKIGLLISASNLIPNDLTLKFFDILFYETYWFYNYANLKRHSCTIHAFGIDTDVMKSFENTEKKYDIIFIGSITKHKRPEKLFNLEGKKIVIGSNDDNELKNKLIENNIEVINFVPYKELANYYNLSKICYVPCEIHGGGERAVLEARACGINVKIEDDNMKLKELINSPIYDSSYYAQQIEKGIKLFLK